MHRLEADRDKLKLKCQQGELQLSKLKQKIGDLETENGECSRKVNEAQALTQ